MTVVGRILVAVVVIATEDQRPQEMKAKMVAPKRRKKWLPEMTISVVIIVVAVIAGEVALVVAAVIAITTVEVVVDGVVVIVALEKTEVLLNKILTAVPCLEA